MTSRHGVTLTYYLTIIKLTGVFIVKYCINETRVKRKEEAKGIILYLRESKNRHME